MESGDPPGSQADPAPAGHPVVRRLPHSGECSSRRGYRATPRLLRGSLFATRRRRPSRTRRHRLPLAPRGHPSQRRRRPPRHRERLLSLTGAQQGVASPVVVVTPKRIPEAEAEWEVDTKAASIGLVQRITCNVPIRGQRRGHLGIDRKELGAGGIVIAGQGLSPPRRDEVVDGASSVAKHPEQD